MQRISTTTKVADKFGAGKHGFTNGNVVGGIPATDLEDAWFDNVQEEIANVIEAGGLALTVPPAAQDRTQLLQAIRKVAVGRLINVQVFTSSGTYTPTAGMTKAIVEGQGAGAGSGGAPATSAGNYSGSPSGASGAYAMVQLTAAQIGVSQAVTIGAPGAAGAAGSSTGGTGGTTSFGSLFSCPGASGSTSYGPTANTVTVINSNSAAAGPTVGVGTLLKSNAGSLPSFAVGSLAGGSGNAVGGIATIDGSTNGAGSGGAGTSNPASTAAAAGNAGKAGKIIVWEYA